MFKEYLVLLLVLIALDYSMANTVNCPHHTFNDYHRCKRYNGAQERPCTEAELIEQAKFAQKKFTGSGKRFFHTIFYYTNDEIFNESGGKCTAKRSLPKFNCERSENDVWSCEKVNDARPVHSTRNGHYEGEA